MRTSQKLAFTCLAFGLMGGITAGLFLLHLGVSIRWSMFWFVLITLLIAGGLYDPLLRQMAHERIVDRADGPLS